MLSWVTGHIERQTDTCTIRSHWKFHQPCPLTSGFNRLNDLDSTKNFRKFK